MNGFAEDNAPYAAPMTKAEFLRWVQRQERRHESTYRGFDRDLSTRNHAAMAELYRGIKTGL